MPTRSPVLVLLAGPNGAGKSTFYRQHLAATRLPFVNADEIALKVFGNQSPETSIPAAALATEMRRTFVNEGRSFIFETVLSDPVGAKVAFVQFAQASGYRIEVHFIGLANPALSCARVHHRVLNGGHDVPEEKLLSRYARTLENLSRLVPFVDRMMIHDNSEISRPHRPVALFERGILTALSPSIPAWLAFLDLPSRATDSTAVIAT